MASVAKLPFQHSHDGISYTFAISPGTLGKEHETQVTNLVGALKGETGKMITFNRHYNHPYELSYGTADVNNICNKEKPVPAQWITENGSDISDDFIAYAAPLIQGNVTVPMKDGLPAFAYRK